jgi:hypothetical protein
LARAVRAIAATASGCSGLSRTIKKTGIVEIKRSTPPPRNTRRSPSSEAAKPPTTGPMALPSAVLDVVLACGVVPLVRAVMRTEALRAPRALVELNVERSRA